MGRENDMRKKKFFNKTACFQPTKQPCFFLFHLFPRIPTSLFPFLLTKPTSPPHLFPRIPPNQTSPPHLFPRIPTMKFAAILALSLGAVNASPATYEPTYAPTYAPTESQTEPPTEPPTQDACAQCAANGALACFRDGVYNPPGELKAQCDGVSHCGRCVTPPSRSPTSNGPAQENCRDCTTATANRSLLFARLPCCSN